MDRVFLDANILFSVAYRPNSRLSELWRFPDIILLTSAYAVEEAHRNLLQVEQQHELDKLLQTIQVIAFITPSKKLPAGIILPQKDAPILLAALAVQASHLLTGDIRHFGAYFGQQIEGVLILPPAEYFRQREA